MDRFHQPLHRGDRRDDYGGSQTEPAGILTYFCFIFHAILWSMPIHNSASVGESFMRRMRRRVFSTLSCMGLPEAVVLMNPLVVRHSIKMVVSRSSSIALAAC